MSKPLLHFLHIGKTGGTAIKEALRNTRDGRYQLVLHDHRFRLFDVPNGEKAFFCLRDPVTRFVSAFYSRQRKGQPRYHYEWSVAERWAFGRYQTPEALATALSGSIPDRFAAWFAIKSIQHVRDQYAYWFGGPEYCARRERDVLLIGFQDSLDRDFACLLRLLDLPPEIQLPRDDIGAHRTPRELPRTLSACAVRNLRRHYDDDVRFIEWCRMWRERLHQTEPQHQLAGLS